MKKWVVELTSDAERRLRVDFKSGVISQTDVKVIKRWIADIEDMGLEFTQHKADWRGIFLETVVDQGPNARRNFVF
jgi:hypothetical protein